MNVNEINSSLSRGAVDDPGVLPHLGQLKHRPVVFSFDFGLDALPTESGILLIRGPRQSGKSTWLEQQIRESVLKYGPGSAYYLNGDEIPNSDALGDRIREIVSLFDPRRKVRRLFVDEITAVSDWQRSVKRLVDSGTLTDVLVVTTGSKAVDLRRGAERLPGRKGRLARTSYHFTPISFAEFARVCGDSLGEGLLAAYIVAGGSPVACSEIAAAGSVPEYVHESVRDWIQGEVAASGRSRASLLAVMDVLHRYGGTPVGQAKLAREAGLANNTVAAGYVEMLADLMCVASASAWDASRRVRIARKPCKYHFTNLLVAACWSPERPRSVGDFVRMGPEAQGKWLEWLVAQELWRRRCIRGEEVPESLAFWQGDGREIDFVLGPNEFVEVKRGSASPVEFAWFSGTFPKSRLTVVCGGSFHAQAVNGMTVEEFLLGEGGG